MGPPGHATSCNQKLTCGQNFKRNRRKLKKVAIYPKFNQNEKTRPTQKLFKPLKQVQKSQQKQHNSNEVFGLLVIAIFMIFSCTWRRHTINAASMLSSRICSLPAISPAMPRTTSSASVTTMAIRSSNSSTPATWNASKEEQQMLMMKNWKRMTTTMKKKMINPMKDSKTSLISRIFFMKAQRNKNSVFCFDCGKDYKTRLTLGKTKKCVYTMMKTSTIIKKGCSWEIRKNEVIGEEIK